MLSTPSLAARTVQRRVSIPFFVASTVLIFIAGQYALANPGDHENAPIGLTHAQAEQQVAQARQLGRAMFFDTTLSASGKMSCASCHDPRYGFGPPNRLSVQLGGRDGKQPGTRAVPSLTYLQLTPAFTEHFHDSDEEGDESIDNGPTGGLTWDGRVDRRRDQARIPLLSANEMANGSPADVVDKVERARYANDFRRRYGQRIFYDSGAAFNAILQALATYQDRYASFFPYTSKYDAYLAGKVALSAQELRGLHLFNDPAKGNCASCHLSQRSADGSLPQFTDYGLIALGVPRNMAIPANRNPNYFDLGLCGPLRTDFLGKPTDCGLFKTPSLRNVALRHTFFHNGIFHSLREVIEFYVERDTRPEKWYPRNRDGSVCKFDDLPPRYRANVNTDPPFGGKPGDPPALNESEISDVIAFLDTLTDGYRLPAQSRHEHDAPPAPLAEKHPRRKLRAEERQAAMR